MQNDALYTRKVTEMDNCFSHVLNLAFEHRYMSAKYIQIVEFIIDYGVVGSTLV